jgi:hypothetical protein
MEKQKIWKQLYCFILLDDRILDGRRFSGAFGLNEHDGTKAKIHNAAMSRNDATSSAHPLNMQA